MFVLKQEKCCVTLPHFIDCISPQKLIVCSCIALLTAACLFAIWLVRCLRVGCPTLMLPL